MTTAPTVPTAPILEFDCAACGQRIAKPGEGVLALDMREVDAIRAAHAEWDRAHPALSSSEPELFNPSALPPLVTTRAEWLAYHDDCRPLSWPYTIELERITEWWMVADWTAHLLGSRDWLRYTDWHALLRRFAGMRPNESHA